MQNPQTYDFIFAGAGASGLMLAWRIIHSPRLKDSSILLIDRDQKDKNDRTWCFWEEPGGEWDSILYRQWHWAHFYGPDHYHREFNLDPFSYKMIRGIDFYEFMHREVIDHPNVDFMVDDVLDIRQKENGAEVRTSSGSFETKQVFSSILDRDLLKSDSRFPLLLQHFKGWVVRTLRPAFDRESVVFMDFRVPQNGNTRFIYVLPFSDTEALVEYTLFSAEALGEEEYEMGIKTYMERILKASDYEILEDEFGIIPMTAYPFKQKITPNIYNIGTLGGQTKASTGFTFKRISRSTSVIFEMLQDGRLEDLPREPRFDYYDKIFIDVLSKSNHLGSSIFSSLFRKNDPIKVLRFLDNRTNLKEEIPILLSCPLLPFTKAALGRMF